MTGLLVANQRPSVEFTHAPVGVNPDDPDFYAYRVYWRGEDPDGRVVRFEFCVDPTATDSVWNKTERSEELILFRAPDPTGPNGPLPRSTGVHTLVLRAVDNEGAYSPFKTRAFYIYTVAPDVQIRSPLPSALLQASIVPSLFIRWEGHDPDGPFHDRPVHYRHRLFSLEEPGNRIFLSDPDSLRRRDGPGGFADWDSSGAESTFVRFTDLTPGNQYLFAVVAYDEAGAYSPVFSLYDNLLQMYVTYASTTGPRIHVYNEVIDFTYESGGYTVDPYRWIVVEAGAGTPFTFDWDAIPAQGSTMDSYRWAVDITRLDDPTPRADEERDIQRWSAASPLATHCELPPLSPGPHFLYIEAKDNNDIVSLGVVRIVVVPPSLEHDLLIVNDTRLEISKPYYYSAGFQPFRDVWPSAAELDTFLFSPSSGPWRYAQALPNALKSPGVFAGYTFDRLGTRAWLDVPSRATSLVKLATYKHVIWIVDDDAASPGRQVAGDESMPVLRYINSRGRYSPLGAYLKLGGRVWIMGGGAATVSADEYNNQKNDDTRGREYSLRMGELGASRIVFDGGHWQSAFSNTHAAITIARSPRADEIAASPWKHEDPFTGRELTAPDYRRLPPVLRYRDPALDPMPPTRFPYQANLCYPTAITSEYLTEPNEIIEDVDRSPVSIRELSVLDTLYEARSVQMRRNPAPTMTWYHGKRANRFVVTGFAPWDFTREDCIGLVDFVLQDLWGLNRRPVDRSLVAPDAAGGVGRSTTPRLTRSPAVTASGVTPVPQRR